MKRWSALPLYAVAILWILWVWLMPLYTPLHYALLILLSAGVYAGLAVVCNRKKPEKDGEEKKAEEKPAAEPKSEPKPEPERKSTGNPELDKLILDRDRAVSEMRRLNDNIPDAALSAQIDDLETTTTRIIDHVLEHPEKLPQIRKFMNYYLPTTLKLLNVYDRMGAQGIREENIGGTMEKVEDTFGRIVQAYHKQLDALFADEALDVSTDITVMKNLLRQEGLLDDGTDFPSGSGSPKVTADLCKDAASGEAKTSGESEASGKADTSGETAAQAESDAAGKAAESGAATEERLPPSPFGEQKPVG